MVSFLRFCKGQTLMATSVTHSLNLAALTLLSSNVCGRCKSETHDVLKVYFTPKVT